MAAAGAAAGAGGGAPAPAAAAAAAGEAGVGAIAAAIAAAEPCFGDAVKFEREEELGSAAAATTSADYYADSYAHFGIHEEMIKDSVRTDSYKKAILGARHKLAGKVVLDVGCGTGILCMFAAQAGARKVIGVDCSNIIHQAREIVKANGFEETITLIQGKVEEISLPEGIEKVDVIISEWMGYFCFYESMLETVLVARDRFLAPGGLIFPDKATLYVAGIEDAEYKSEKIDWWQDVYGFNMSCIKDLAMLEPLVDIVNAEAVVTTAAPLLTIDIQTMTKEELTFQCPFKVSFNKNEYVQALCVWFDIEFSHSHKPVHFSTGPHAKYTHWKQAVCYLEDEICGNAGEAISGVLRARPNAKNHRDLDIELAYAFHGKHMSVERVQPYRLR